MIKKNHRPSMEGGEEEGRGSRDEEDAGSKACSPPEVRGKNHIRIETKLNYEWARTVGGGGKGETRSSE